MKTNINRKKKGQSTLEYIILVTAVIVAMVVFLGPNGIFRNNIGNAYDVTTRVMINMANQVRDNNR